MTQYAFHLDGGKCTGCKTCQVACKETYKLPVSNLYRKVYNYQGGSWKPTEAGHYVPDGVFGYFVSLACNHCSSPGLRGELPHRCHAEGRGDRHRLDRSRRVHRLQDLRDRLPLGRADLRRGRGLHVEMRHVPRRSGRGRQALSA